MAHAIHLSDREKAPLRDKGVMLAHCALSNTNLSSGIMPLRQDLEQGLRCCVASDVAGGHTANLSRSITATVQASKLNWLNHPDQAPLSLTEAFYLATVGRVPSWARWGPSCPALPWTPWCSARPPWMLWWSALPSSGWSSSSMTGTTGTSPPATVPGRSSPALPQL